jgi:hypothetical protein
LTVTTLSIRQYIKDPYSCTIIKAGPSGFEPETAGFLQELKVRYSTWLSYGP